MHQRGTSRLSSACEPCKRKKRKCDGASPFCSSCARAPSACIYVRPNPRGLPPGYLIALEQRLADTEAMLSLSLSLILELTHNNFAEEIPPAATESGITEETLILKKDTVLKFYENSTSRYRRSGKIGTPDTSAEKRERQEEWESWPLATMDDAFSWWSKKYDMPLTPTQAQRMIERVEELTAASSSPTLMDETMEDHMERSPLSQSFGDDGPYQEPVLPKHGVTRQLLTQQALEDNLIPTNSPNVTMGRLSPYAVSQTTGPLPREFAEPYPPELYTPGSNSPHSANNPPGFPRHRESYPPVVETHETMEGERSQDYMTRTPSGRGSPKKPVSDSVRKVLDMNSEMKEAK